MFNASVRLSVCLKPKFGQLFDVSCSMDKQLNVHAKEAVSVSSPKDIHATIPLAVF